MTRFLCAVAAIALIAPAAASAQQDNRHNGNNGNRPAQNHARPANQGQGRVARPAMQNGQAARQSFQRGRMAPTRQNVATQMNGYNRGYRANGTARMNNGARATTNARAFRPGSRPATYHRIQAPAFRYPRGYSYRRWGIGAILPSLFLSNYYYWNNWAALGLGPPPPGFVWVRYGPDLLLVNRYNGRIADVIYGAFY